MVNPQEIRMIQSLVDAAPACEARFQATLQLDAQALGWSVAAEFPLGVLDFVCATDPAIEDTSFGRVDLLLVGGPNVLLVEVKQAVTSQQAYDKAAMQMRRYRHMYERNIRGKPPVFTAIVAEKVGVLGRDIQPTVAVPLWSRREFQQTLRSAIVSEAA